MHAGISAFVVTVNGEFVVAGSAYSSHEWPRFVNYEIFIMLNIVKTRTLPVGVVYVYSLLCVLHSALHGLFSIGESLHFPSACYFCKL